MKNTHQDAFTPKEPHKILFEEAADDIVATYSNGHVFAADLYRVLVENSHDVLFSLDTQGTFTYISPAIEQLAQYQASEVIGQPFFSFVHPDDLPDVEMSFQQALIGNLEPSELRVFNSVGAVLQVRISTRPLRKSNQLVGLTGIIVDITETKRAEEALRRAHDEMEEHIKQQTAELRRANEQLTALYQVGQAITALSQLKLVLDVIARNAAELLGSDTGVILLVDETGETLTIQGAFGLSEAVVKGTRDRVGESIAGRVVRTGQSLIVNDLPNDPRFYNPSAVDEGLLACASVPLVVGEKIIGTLDIHSKTNRHAFSEEHIHVLYMLASQAAIAIKNARLYDQLQLAHDELERRVQQRTAELIAANTQLQQDIIERKRAEKEKDALQVQLLQAQKMESVGRLAGSVAHDYNNMLAVILIQVKLALRESDPVQPVYARLQAIQQATQHSIDLTRQLLTFARKQTIIPKVLNINETVEGALAMLHRLIGENIELLWKPTANLWSVKMDPVQINQILTNLVVNARDAISGAGEIIIETAHATFDEEYCAVHPDCVCGDYVALTVSDDGSGMEKNTLEHLFEPFFTTKEAGKGTGLGLPTVYGIVKQNNGFITVDSELGKGSTLGIYLPRFASEAA